MFMAFDLSSRGTCSRRQVGALVADKYGVVIVSGWNGAMRGFEHCAPHEDYQPCDVSEHAERNCIYSSSRLGIALEDKDMYVTDAPCFGCARGIVQTGLRSVTYARDYRVNEGLTVMERAGVHITRYTGPYGR